MEERFSFRMAGGEPCVQDDRTVGMPYEERCHDDRRALQVRRAREFHRHGVVPLMDADDVARAQHQAVRRRGSSASRSESPKRLNPNTAMLIAMPGAIASHGARSRNCMPAPRSMRPQDGVGSNTPSPRNDS